MLTKLTDLILSAQVETLLTTRHTNWDGLKETLTENGNKLVMMNQVHGNHVRLISQTQIRSQSIEVFKTDAVMTEEKSVWLAVKTADCVPILIYHPKPVIAAIHAGRKGLELGVISNTLQKIQQKTNQLDGLKIWLGPCICESCYEINRETKEHYNLLEKAVAQIESFVQKPTIHISGMCTSCQNEDFFSYRKGDVTERLYSLIKLK